MLLSIKLNIHHIVLLQFGTWILLTSPITSLSKWQFESTAFKNWAGEVGKIDDPCNYTLWKEHSQPVIDAIEAYVRVKNDVKKQYNKAKKNQKTTAANPYDYVYELAEDLHKKREEQALKVRAKINLLEKEKGQNTKTESGIHYLKEICDGDELLHCKKHGESEAGVCSCFDLAEGGKFYKLKEEDKHCRGQRNSTCSPDDPLVTIECHSNFKCINLSVKACLFAHGDGVTDKQGNKHNLFHCTGASEKGDDIGNQNMFCSRPGDQPENANDKATGINLTLTLHHTCILLLSLSATIFRSAFANNYQGSY